MPIEIRELQITVVEEGAAASSAAGAAAVDASAGNTEKIVALCVEQVMDILRQKNER
jgi:hypothetical protein